MSAAILRMPAAPRDCNTVRAALRHRANAIHAGSTQRQRAAAVAMTELRAGASTAWAITQGCRQLRGTPLHVRPAPGGAA